VTETVNSHSTTGTADRVAIYRSVAAS